MAMSPPRKCSLQVAWITTAMFFTVQVVALNGKTRPSKTSRSAGHESTMNASDNNMTSNETFAETFLKIQSQMAESDFFTDHASFFARQRAGLVEKQHENKLALGKQRDTYVVKLKAQLAEVHATESSNAQIAVETDELRKLNEHRRLAAEKLSRANDKLESDIKVMRGNLTIVTEFIARAVDAAASSYNGTELKVLAELAEQDELQAKALAHKMRLSAVGMLQRPQKVGLNSTELLHFLISSYDRLTEEQNASETSMRNAFQTAFQRGTEKHKALLEEQIKLNVTRRAEQELGERLAVAVRHLETVQQQLVNRSQSIRLFMRNFEAHSVGKVNAHALGLVQIRSAIVNAGASSDSSCLTTSHAAHQCPDVVAI